MPGNGVIMTPEGGEQLLFCFILGMFADDELKAQEMPAFANREEIRSLMTCILSAFPERITIVGETYWESLAAGVRLGVNKWSIMRGKQQHQESKQGEGLPQDDLSAGDRPEEGTPDPSLN